MEMIIIYFVWASLLVIPPLAVGVFALTRRLCPNTQPAIFKAIVAWLVLTIVFLISKISFASPLANFACLIIAYFSYCYSSLSLCWRIPKKIIRVFALMGIAIPVSIGYLLGTIGVLGLMFIVGDYARPPNHMEQMRPGLVCETTVWGMAASDEGYIVHLYRFWEKAPLIRQEVVNMNVDETAGQAGASCADALVKYIN